MKLRDLRSCDWCGKQIAGRMPDGRLSIQFYVLTLATAILNPRALNQNLGLVQMLGGSLQLAEVFSSEPDVALIVEDQPGAGGRDEALLCFDCWIGLGHPELRLAALAERIADRKAKAAEEQAARDRDSPGAGVHDPTKDPRSLPRRPRRAPATPPEETS